MLCRSVNDLRNNWHEIRRGARDFSHAPSRGAVVDDSSSASGDSLEDVPLAARSAHYRARQALEKERVKEKQKEGDSAAPLLEGYRANARLVHLLMHRGVVPLLDHVSCTVFFRKAGKWTHQEEQHWKIGETSSDAHLHC